MASNSKLTRILSIDGGGIRGIIPGQILVTLEGKLKELDQNPQARIGDYFDLIAGTSTGGILACLYLTPQHHDTEAPRYSAQEVVDFYLKRGGEVFYAPWRRRVMTAGGLTDEKYAAQPMERVLYEYLGDLRLSQLIKPCLIPAYDIHARRAHFFTQFNARQGIARDYLVSEVIRATTAAPSYFEVAQARSFTDDLYPLIDGGVFANNPSMCAYAEARTMTFDEYRSNPTAADMVVLSLGTGRSLRSYPYDEAKDWGLVSWIRPLIDIMMAGVSDTVDYQMMRMYQAVERPEQYLRISPDLGDASPDLDDVSPSNLQALRAAGLANASRMDKRLTAMARLLIANK